MCDRARVRTTAEALCKTAAVVYGCAIRTFVKSVKMEVFYCKLARAARVLQEKEVQTAKREASCVVAAPATFG